ncbi:hypothetical protein M0802_010527 [Mischocyttarus mexicanus]|nr:hypothetical protein M0802_010527 [Mischocyttarus mexicanus]
MLGKKGKVIQCCLNEKILTVQKTPLAFDLFETRKITEVLNDYGLWNDYSETNKFGKSLKLGKLSRGVSSIHCLLKHTLLVV